MMPNHPNRQRNRANNAAANPTPSQIKDARIASGLLQADAAALVYSTANRWSEWETGAHRMHPGLYELFLLKTRTQQLSEFD